MPVWSRVGRWFRDNADPGESLSAMPIGALSYYSGLIVYDMLGLTDRHIARIAVPEMGSGWAGHEKQDAQYILDRRPTYLLLCNIDVTQQPRDARQVPFIPYSNQNIFNRERGFYVNKRLLQMYRPRSVEVEKGLYLNFYELKEELRDKPSD